MLGFGVCLKWSVIACRFARVCSTYCVLYSCLSTGSQVTIVVVAVKMPRLASLYFLSQAMGAFSRQRFFQELAHGCLLPTAQQGLEQVWQLLVICLLCRLLWMLGKSPLLLHLISVTHRLHTLSHLPFLPCQASLLT